MRIAILHYHLRPGGVTRVIELAWEALAARGIEPLVISGEPRPPACRLPLHAVAVVPELAYDSTSDPIPAIEAACRRHWGAPADVFHTHNHSLGKNSALPRAVAHWAKAGRALVLQIHDFAENSRPGNHRLLREAFGGFPGLSRTLYPHAGHIALACLTHGAAAKLEALGARCHILPNPILLPRGGTPFEARDAECESLTVYPTRGIPRKNLGEALLHAAFAQPGEKFLITSAPEKGEDLAAYQSWQQLAGHLSLPILFDTARTFQRPVEEFLLGANHCLTTSIEEGFGMAFLEPWSAGKSLKGRNLPAVTRDFLRDGIVLPSLYPRWDIPSEILDRPAVSTRLAARLQALLNAYEQTSTPEHLDRILSAVWSDRGADFGRLDLTTQIEILQSPHLRNLPRPHTPPTSPEIIRSNQGILRKTYSLSNYALRLTTLYQGILTAPAAAANFLDASKVLSHILDLDDFSALRCPHVG